MKRLFSKFNTIVTAIMAVVALTVAATGLLVTTTYHGQIKALVVRSGSMEPTLPVGSLIVAKKPESYKIGDVITFEQGKSFVTHRIKHIHNGQFQTQGDANKTPDLSLVPTYNVVGRLWFSIPNAGRMLVFIKSPLGFSLFIMVPSLLVVIQEIAAIGRELEKMNKAKEAAKKKLLDLKIVPTLAKLQRITKEEISASKTRLGQAIIMTLIAGLGAIGGTKAYFSDLGQSFNNIVTAGQFTATTMIINELLYSSDCSNADQKQWIELWNGSATTVNLKNWKLKNEAGTTVDITTLNKIVGPGEFVLVSKSTGTWNTNCYGSEPAGVTSLTVGSSFTINITNGFVELLDSTGTVIDHAEYGNFNSNGSPSVLVNTSVERKFLGFDTAPGAAYHAFDFIARFPQSPGLALPDIQAVVINEFRISPNNQEFVELYNRSGSPVDISNWTLNMSAGNNTFATLAPGTTLASGASTTINLNNVLSNGGGKIYLKDTNSKIQDAFSYYKFDPGGGLSWARIPDGADNWQIDSSPTPNGVNIL